MIEIPVYNLDGKQTETLQVDEQSLGGEVRPALLKQAYVMYHANKRQGSAANRSRGMKAGSTKKLYRQKGTGNARMGTRRTNLRRGGGVAFAKAPRSHRMKMPAQMRRLAARNAFLAKIVDDEVKVIDGLKFDQPKTKQFANLMKTVGINRTCLVALEADNTNAQLSARNISDVEMIRTDQLNAYDLLSRRFLLVDKTSLQGWLDGTAAKSDNGQEEAA